MKGHTDAFVAYRGLSQAHLDFVVIVCHAIPALEADIVLAKPNLTHAPDHFKSARNPKTWVAAHMKDYQEELARSTLITVFILQAELIAYFVSGEASGANSRFMRDLIKPLPFDPALEADYLAALRSDRHKLEVLDELEAHYEDVEDFKKRRDMLEAATSDHLSYGSEEEDSED